MYDIISAFQCYTISVDVYFPFHCTLWMVCFTFLLILCYCCCAHDNDVSHTLHWEWGVTLPVIKGTPKYLTGSIPLFIPKGSIRSVTFSSGTPLKKISL